MSLRRAEAVVPFAMVSLKTRSSTSLLYSQVVRLLFGQYVGRHGIGVAVTFTRFVHGGHVVVAGHVAHWGHSVVVAVAH
jgi:acyl-coenzyme A thioesterase PaaI-like protein